MQTRADRIEELAGVDPGELPGVLLDRSQPLVLRGLVAHWPLVRAGLESARVAAQYLKGFCGDATVGVWLGDPAIDGRFFYNEDFSGFNFRAEMHKLEQVLGQLDDLLDVAQAPAIYVGSTTIDSALPGFRADNDVALGERQALASIWIGNRTRIAAHHDLPDNLACVAVGHRRVTLFAPGEVGNLYVGPLDFTPAGQAISLVDFARPDLARFPRFADALKRAWVVELAPGDAIFIPSMWWHHVEALDRCNVLVNYWWRQSPDYMDSPMNALMLAIMTVRDLPAAEREAWRQMFDHYIFAGTQGAAAHVPVHARRLLAPLDAAAARVLRARLLKKLNR